MLPRSISGFRGRHLAGAAALRAAHSIELAARSAVLGYVKACRERGLSWHEIGASATASVYNAYRDENNVYVNSNEPYRSATASADGYSWSYQTNMVPQHDQCR